MKEIDKVVSNARQLRRAALPAKACILEVLSVLGPEGIERLARGNASSGKDLNEISDAINYDSRVVADVLGKFLQFDMHDYSAPYSFYKGLYVSSGYSEAAITSVIKGQSEDPTIHCVFRDALYWWAYEEGSFAPVLIEDNELYYRSKGYLICTGLVFHDAVELLGYSYHHRWPRWEALWRYF